MLDLAYYTATTSGPDVVADLDALARATTLDDVPEHLRMRVEEAGAEDDLRDACDLVADTLVDVAHGNVDDAGAPDDLDDLDLDA